MKKVLMTIIKLIVRNTHSVRKKKHKQMGSPICRELRYLHHILQFAMCAPNWITDPLAHMHVAVVPLLTIDEINFMLWISRQDKFAAWLLGADIVVSYLWSTWAQAHVCAQVQGLIRLLLDHCAYRPCSSACLLTRNVSCIGLEAL